MSNYLSALWSVIIHLPGTISSEAWKAAKLLVGEKISLKMEELGDEWAEKFDDDHRELLYEEGKARVREVREFGVQQEKKAFTLLTLGIAGIGASGILGDLTISGSPVGFSSIVAMFLSILVLRAAYLIVKPEQWDTGINISDAVNTTSTSDMQQKAVEGFVEAFTANRIITATRGELLRILFFVVILQICAIVSVEVLSSLSVSGEHQPEITCPSPEHPSGD